MMFFSALVILGIVAWRTIPVELFPPLSGARLFVTFSRPGSEPEVGAVDELGLVVAPLSRVRRHTGYLLTARQCRRGSPRPAFWMR